jgi:YD repeat-containing protein
MKHQFPEANVKPAPARCLALLGALILAAAQSLPAQTALQAGLIVTNLGSAGQDGVTFSLSWAAPANGVYLVQSSTNLGDPAGWTTEDLVQAGSGPLEWTSPEAVQQQKFYRLVVPQTQIFSAEPSVLLTGTTQTVLLAGQLFPANAQVLVNGAVDSDVTIADSSDILVTFNASAPGAYVIELTAAGAALSSVTVNVYAPSAPPAYALQEPPEDPPGSPVTPALSVISKPMDKSSPMSIFREVDPTGRPSLLSSTAKPTKHTATTATYASAGISSAALKHPTAFSGGSSSAALNWGGGDESPVEYAAFNLQPPSSPGGAWTTAFATWSDGEECPKESVAFSSRYGYGGEECPKETVAFSSWYGHGGDESPKETVAFSSWYGHGGDESPKETVAFSSRYGYGGEECPKETVAFSSRYGHGGDESPKETATLLMPALMKAKEKANQTKCGVSLSSGEVQAQATDLEIPGVGLDFVWTRTYRSRTGPGTALGPRWDFSYDIFCQSNSQSVTVFDGAGRQDVYQQQSDGTFACPGCFRQGTTNLNAFRLTFADGGYWAFLPFDGSVTAGKIAQIVDRNGNTISFQYNTSGQLAVIVDTLGRAYTLSYSTGGQIQALTDFAGRAVTYQYYSGGTGGTGGTGGGSGPVGELESVTSPAVTGTPNGNDFPAGKTTAYTYSSGYANAAENNLLLSVTDPLGQTAHVFTYDHNAGDFSYLRCTNEQCGYPGEALTYDWEPRTPQAGQYAVIKCVVNDAAGNVTEYYYDSGNRPLRRLEYSGRATPGVTTTSTANRPTGRLRAADPAYFETDWQWNNDSLCTLETEPGGDSVQNVYQGDLNPNTPARFRANLIHQREHPPVNDTADAAVSPDGLDTYYQYDPRFGTETTLYVRKAGGDPRATLSFKKTLDSSSPKLAFFPVSVTDPRKNQTAFTYDGSGNLTHLQHAGNVPAAAENAVAPEDFTYNAAGQMTSHTLPDNGSGYRRVDQAAYYTSGPQQGYLESVTVDAGGDESPKETITFEYDAVGNITNWVDPRGNAYTYTVNALNQIVQEQSPPVSTTVPVRYTNQYAYDADDNLVSVTTPGINGDGAPDDTVTGLTTWTYDALNFVASESGRIYSGQNAVTLYQYDANRNVTNIILPEAANGHNPANRVAYLYDERDLPFQRVRAPGSPQQSTDQFNVTLDGEISQVAHGLEAGPEVKNFFYDGFERLLAEEDAMGNVLTNNLDANGNVVLQTFIGPTNQSTGAAGVRLAQSAFAYDNLNRPRRRIDAFFDLTTGAPIGSGRSATSVTYSDFGNVTSRTDARGNTTVFTYDTVNRPASVTDAAGNVVQYAYDSDNNVTSETETDRSGLGGQSQVFTLAHQYDNLNRPATNIDNVGNNYSWAYNSRNDLTRSTDARGNDTFFQYDGLNRRTAAIGDMNGDGIPDLGDIETQAGYDADSRLIAFTDPNGNITSYTYDSLNRVIQTQWADGSFSTNGYDPYGNVTQSVDQNGTVLTNAYDLLNRRVSTTVLAFGGATAETGTFETFSYDGLSRLVQWANDAAACGAAYDSLGDCVSETLNGQSTTSTFDATGNRLTLTYPGGGVLTYAYDSLNRQTNVSGGGAMLETLAYFGPGRLAARLYANGTSNLFFYDGVEGTANAPGDFGWGQISGVIVLPSTSGSGTPAIADWGLQYDPNGNKTARVQTAAFGATGGTLGPQQQSFSYDPVDRLTNANVYSGTSLLRWTAYALDLAGNRTNVGGYNETCGGIYTLNAAEAAGPENFQLNEYTTTGCDYRQYNSNQDLTEISVSTGGGAVGIASGVSFGYDFRDRLVSINNSATRTNVSYAYDALGRRIQKTVATGQAAPSISYLGDLGNGHKEQGGSSPTQATSYFYDGGNVIEEQDGSGAVQAAYTLDGNNHLVLVSRSGQTYYYHDDDSGNVFALTDAGGNVVERYDYDDYGRPAFLNPDGSAETTGAAGAATPAAQSSVGNPYLFQSFQWEPESGVYMIEVTDNLGKKRNYSSPAGLASGRRMHKPFAVYYDPKSGRDITPSDELVSSGNAFDFEGNNPWSRGVAASWGRQHNYIGKVTLIK